MEFKVETNMFVAMDANAGKAGNPRKNGQYVVQKGDTWISLAKKFGVPNAEKQEVWQEFSKLCGGGELKIGQKIKVPSAKINFKTYESNLFRSEKRAARKTSEAAQEALRQIAKACGMTFKEFCKLNGISQDYIPKAGENFYIRPNIKAAGNAPAKKAQAPKTQDNKPAVPADKRIAKYKNGSQTVDQLRNGAIKGGQKGAKEKFKEYCSQNNIKYDPKLLDLTPINRFPKPTIDKNGNITTTKTELLGPTKGNNGRVVIIDAGHGGYSNNSGYFDPGAYSFIQKRNGKYAPLLEYEVAQRYAENLADKLRAKGYSVIIASGHVDTFASENAFNKMVTQLQNGTYGSSKKKFKKDNISFLSLHADSASAKGQKYSAVCYDPKNDSKDNTFANALNSNLNEDDWIKSDLQQRIKGINGLNVLNQTIGVPSVLLEIEYVNGSRAGNLDSSNYESRFINKILEAYSDYYGDKK